MNTATATQRLQAICLLSLALLVSLTSDGAHISERTIDNRSESFLQASPSCEDSHAPLGIFVDHGSHQTAPSCNTLSEFETITPLPTRLVRPLSGSQYPRAGDSIRYSF